jgi:hypothetical protein
VGFNLVDEKEYCVTCAFDGFEVEIYNGGSLSRCLRCRRATEEEVSAEEYFKSKNNT